MAYRIQAETFGDLDRKSIKRLERLTHDSSREGAISAGGLVAGGRSLREPVSARNIPANKENNRKKP
jgi:hypothetical protein